MDLYLHVITTSECKALWGEPEEVPSFAIHTVHGFLLSVVEFECEALEISEVGAITAEEVVTRIQSDQRREPERLECHSDRVYCVCARAGWVCLQTAPILIDYVHRQIYVYI